VRVVSPLPNSPAGESPLVGCLKLLIQPIFSYPPCLKVISSTHILSILHAVLTRDPLNVGKLIYHIFYCYGRP